MEKDKTIARRRLGRTELAVTALSLGAMNLRRLPTFDDARAIVNHALDLGVNLIDTARAYKGDVGGALLESEVIVGEVIRGRTDLTEPVVLITKGHGYTIDVLEEEVAISRAALGIEGRHDLTIGQNEVKLIYFLHGITTERWAVIESSGVLERLVRLKSEGLVHAVGFSSHYPHAKEIKAAIDTGVFDVCELPYNAFDRSLGEDGDIDMMRYAFERDMGVVNMKAFDGNGMQPMFPMLREFIDVSHEALLRFCLSNPYVATVDAGARWPKELDDDLAAALAPIMTDDERERLKQEADKVAPHRKSVCHACMHCMEKFECPHGVAFVEPLSLFARHTLHAAFGRDTSAFKAAYAALPAQTCKQCGLCLPWCEYQLNIPEQLKAAHAALTQ